MGVLQGIRRWAQVLRCSPLCRPSDLSVGVFSPPRTSEPCTQGLVSAISYHVRLSEKDTGIFMTHTYHCSEGKCPLQPPPQNPKPPKKHPKLQNPQTPKTLNPQPLTLNPKPQPPPPPPHKREAQASQGFARGKPQRSPAQPAPRALSTTSRPRPWGVGLGVWGVGGFGGLGVLGVLGILGVLGFGVGVLGALGF